MLSSLELLDAETAAALLESFPGGDLTLNLTSLSADTSQELAKVQYNSLFLDRLTELSDDTAAALGTFAGKKAVGSNPNKLNLFGLTRLSPAASRGLAAF